MLRNTSCCFYLLFCSSYVEILESFLRYTPSDHVDRKNLTQAIAKFKDLDGLFREVKKINSCQIWSNNVSFPLSGLYNKIENINFTLNVMWCVYGTFFPLLGDLC